MPGFGPAKVKRAEGQSWGKMPTKLKTTEQGWQDKFLRAIHNYVFSCIHRISWFLPQNIGGLISGWFIFVWKSKLVIFFSQCGQLNFFLWARFFMYSLYFTLSSPDRYKPPFLLLISWRFILCVCLYKTIFSLDTPLPKCLPLICNLKPVSVLTLKSHWLHWKLFVSEWTGACWSRRHW